MISGPFLEFLVVPQWCPCNISNNFLTYLGNLSCDPIFMPNVFVVVVVAVVVVVVRVESDCQTLTAVT